ncbi:histone-lysine N-methyltransferase H3 lysine-9 specific SUVH4-like [Tripterygium wilfordii]|uniref:Histone-lysine N-methyltransferase H3 lysine-9 specific SUVH4-like n=1 Tax=Tripterygium wilfordii TaxID=458696 RepID=A0A7J7D581_TRIWF|nr:histone-lysine N-methyltransferase H3 lysine-9 specific SUVH4-like [Tripterygium wilfordii]
MGDAGNVSSGSHHGLDKSKSPRGHSLPNRVSPRLQNIPIKERPYYGNERKRLSDHPKDDVVTKNAKVDHVIQEDLSNVARVERKDKVGKGCLAASDILPSECGEREIIVLSDDDDDLDSTPFGGIPADSTGKSPTARVKETLRKFNTHYLQFVQKGNPSDPVKGCTRPDLKAISEDSTMFCFDFSGINVGHQFFSRAEMMAVGFHGHWLNGIDYMGKAYGKLEDYKGYTFPLAVAIVMSGQYEDDVDNSNEIVYTGQGGNDLLNSKRQIKDQVLCRGNLALKNNMEQRVAVRVVRGHDYANGQSRRVYTYCGLYMVENYWSEKGVSGFIIFKYRLRRMERQPKLEIDKVMFSMLVCMDISNGQEAICIPATNLIDDPPTAPTGFEYTRFIQVAKGLTIPSSAQGCNCKGKCTNSKTCSCAKLNGSDFPYVEQDGGRLIEPKDVVFECGPACGCGPNCVNRTSQRGIKYRLEVYRTEDKGWAVRSWDFIPSGAPVCEYAGVLRKNTDLENVSGNDYIFDIDCWHTMNGIGGREKRQGDESVPTIDVEKIDDKMLESDSEFCIHACSHGNVARFINHSCEPNLFVQCVLSSHHDMRLARVILFAADPIPPFQELTYDYGYALDSVIGPDGKLKQMPCYCGTADCRKRMY